MIVLEKVKDPYLSALEGAVALYQTPAERLFDVRLGRVDLISDIDANHPGKNDIDSCGKVKRCRKRKVFFEKDTYAQIIITDHVATIYYKTGISLDDLTIRWIAGHELGHLCHRRLVGIAGMLLVKKDFREAIANYAAAYATGISPAALPVAKTGKNGFSLGDLSLFCSDVHKIERLLFMEPEKSFRDLVRAYPI